MRLPLRLTLPAAASTVLALAFAGPAMADSPQFHAATSSVDNAGALVATFDERGLGNGNIDYTLTADATAVYACVNGGSNHPKAANKQTINAEVGAGGSFEAKNGRIQASLAAGPPSAGDFSCPSGQRLVLASVSYTNIELTDTTNDVTANLADASRTLVTL